MQFRDDQNPFDEIHEAFHGVLDDMYFRYFADIGIAGPGKSKGSKYLLLPPDYEGKVSQGYFIAKSKTYCVWNFIHGYLKGEKIVDIEKASREG